MLGTTARLAPLKFGTGLSESTPDRFTTKQAHGRRWAFDTSRPDGSTLREWTVDMDLLEERDLSLIEEFTQGGWGPGPFRFVPAAAQVSSVLTPPQSLLTRLDAETGMATSDGWAPRSVIGPGQVVLAARVPVLPGGPVTVAVETTGAAVLTLTFRSGTGGVVSTLAAAEAAGTLAQRLVYSAPSVVSTARTVDVQVSGHVRASRPQVSWTTAVPGWSVGRAAEQVVVQSASTAFIGVKASRFGAWSSASVKILEVG